MQWAANFKSCRFDEADRLLQGFEQHFPSSPLLGYMKLASGANLLWEGKDQIGLSELKEVEQSYPNSVLAVKAREIITGHSRW
jgi:hypothetical protein